MASHPNADTAHVGDNNDSFPHRRSSDDRNPFPHRRSSDDRNPVPKWRSSSDNHPIPQRRSSGDNHPIPQRRSSGDNHPTPQRMSTGGNHPIPQRISFGDNNPMPQRRSSGDNHPVPQRRSSGDNNPIQQRISFGNNNPMPQRRSSGDNNPIPPLRYSDDGNPVPPRKFADVRTAIPPRKSSDDRTPLQPRRSPNNLTPLPHRRSSDDPNPIPPRKPSDPPNGFMFATVPRERPQSQPPPETRRDSTGINSKRRSSSSNKRSGRNSINITSESGTILTVTDHPKPLTMAKGLRHAEKEKEWAEVTRHDLYKEAMYTCVHMLGTPSAQRFPATQEEMCIYVHKTFSESQKEQEAVVDHVRSEPFPLMIVNTRVKRAYNLVGSKPNGVVDPYCVVTIETEDSVGKREWKKFASESPLKKERLRKKHLRPPPEKRSLQIYEKIPAFIKTVLQRHKSDPKWDQRFQCLALRPSVDHLTVEVWDHSIDDQYVAKAIRNYSDQDGTEELNKRLKSYQSNAHRKHGDVFLGKVAIRVAEVPCDGLDQWFPLEGTPQTKDSQAHGKLRLQLWLVHAYRHGRHFAEVAEPKVILGHFWEWILRKEQAACPDPDKWDGSIPSAATCFLFQYALQNGIGEDTHVIIRWNAYSKFDLNLPTMEVVMVDLKEVIEKQDKKDAEGQTVEQAQAPPRIRESQANIEDDLLRMVKTKIVPVIRIHWKESIDNVHDALRSYQGAVEILSKFEKPFLLQNINWLIETALRIGILEWYEELYEKTVPGDGKQSERIHYVNSVAKVMREVNIMLKQGGAKWGHEFWLTASMQYLPIVYDELQKVVVHDVERTCWIFFEFYNDYKKLRKILLSNEENDRLFRNAFFDLYTQTDKFVTAQNDIFPEDGEPFCLLSTFHRWFRPTLILWLGYAIIKGSTIISKTINIDNNLQDNPHAKTSSSSLDTATVFCQLVQFWELLKWPDIAESYVIINFLMDVICSYTILYADLKHAKLEKEGYYDPDGRFDISEKLCTALNNIENVKDQAQSIPSIINYSHLLEQLEEACGKSALVLKYQKNAQLRLEQTAKIVDKHIDDILDNVGRRIQKDMASFIEQSFYGLLEVSSEKLVDAVEPIVAYLDDNINTLANALLSRNFHKVLLLLWNLVCRGLEVNAAKFELAELDDQYIFFKRLMQVIPYLQEYFKGGDAGLSLEDMDSPEFQQMNNIFKYFTMSTNELIGMYYYAKSQAHLNYVGHACLGMLRVRAGYWNGKLCVEVLSATDLTPHDEPLTIFKYFQKQNPTSDPMVEVELKPESLFVDVKQQSTDVKWRNLNPTFDQSFYWKVELEDCLKPSSVILLTVKDYDLLSQNDFLGEAVIPMHVIPGVSSQPLPQPMNLTLHEVDKTNQALTVLNTRKWDSTAKQFYDDETARYVEPVIVRKECQQYARD